MFNVNIVASSYTGHIYITWDEVHDEITKYELYKDDELVAQSFDEDSSFIRPTIFDHDHHTNLFTKESNHQLMYEDTNVVRYKEYKYYVKAYRIVENETKEELTSEIKYAMLT